MNDNKTEYVYCMSNKSFNRDLVKIGWTKNEPKKRAQQLYTTGVPNPFTIEFIIKTPDGRSLDGGNGYLWDYRRPVLDDITETLYSWSLISFKFLKGRCAYVSIRLENLPEQLSVP